MGDNPEDLRKELERRAENSGGDIISRAAIALLDTYIGGGLVGAVAGTSESDKQAEMLRIIAAWMALQEDEIKEIGRTMSDVLHRIDTHDERIKERITSKEYKSLMKKAFRDWSAAESDEKRRLVTNLLTNAAAASITSDDVVRSFIDWIDDYSELHFKVIGEIYNRDGITRHDIWHNLHGEIPRDDSPEADLFKLIIHELSTGHVIRQHRETDAHGQFLQKSRTKTSGRGGSRTMKSAFDDEEEYELTELGKQFVHYTMSEYVVSIENQSSKPI